MSEPVSFRFDGVPMTAPRGSTVATGLITNGVSAFRTTRADDRPRGIFCGIGWCFDCLVDVDEETSVRACITPLAAGADVRRSGSVGGRRAR
ncbi:MAG TPA: (2Fe-2S)-binding protein [Mycobacteriales bacterium]